MKIDIDKLRKLDACNSGMQWLISLDTTDAAEQVISIYENRYPENDAPRKAIGAARNYLMDPSDENRRLAADAAYAADAAAYAAAADAADAMEEKCIWKGLEILQQNQQGVVR